jgi:hypothetical protein
VYWSVVAYIFLVPLVGCIFALLEMSLASSIMFYLSDFCLAVCCVFLTDGLVRMIKCMTDNHLVNINYLIANILVYLLVIVSAVLSDIPFQNAETKFAMLEAFLVSGLVSQLLLLIILNKILSLIIK